MPRIRSIKPETFADELLGSLPRDVRLLYIGLWTLSDDAGRFRANPSLIRSSLFPYDLDIGHAEVLTWLRLLTDKGRIQVYESAGQQYGVIVRWTKHQKIDHAGASRLPEPPKRSGGKPARRLKESSRDSRDLFANARETLAPDLGPRKGVDLGPRKGGEGIGQITGVEPEAGSTPLVVRFEASQWPSEVRVVAGRLAEILAALLKHDSPDLDPPARKRFESTRTGLEQFDDPAFWLAIDEWLGGDGSKVFYLDEFRAFWAWHLALPLTKRKRALKQTFRNWLAKSERWKENDAQREAIRQNNFRR